MKKFAILGIAEDECTCSDDCPLLTWGDKESEGPCFKCFLFGRLDNDINGREALRAGACINMEYIASQLIKMEKE